MNGFMEFVRKEMLEQVRTFRLLILLVAFILVGLGSPIIAKVTPELLARFAKDDLGGMQLILLKPPGIADALFQYQKNFVMLPLLVLLMYAGCVSSEKNRGTAAMALVKPVSRNAFLVAKAAVPAVLLLIGTLLAGCGCYLYTTVLFGAPDMLDFLFLNTLLLGFLIFHLALALVASIVTPSIASSIGVAIGSYAVLALLGALPGIGRWTPSGLTQAVTDIVLGREVTTAASGAMAAGVLFVALMLFGARMFRRQEL